MEAEIIEQLMKLENTLKRFCNFKRKNSSNSKSSRCIASRIGFEWAVKQKDCELVVDIDCDLANDPAEIIEAIDLFRKKL